MKTNGKGQYNMNKFNMGLSYHEQSEEQSQGLR